MRRILAILMENEPGSLSRIVGLFSQRAFNIESLTVAPTADNSLSRMTITTIGDDHVLEQIVKQVRLQLPLKIGLESMILPDESC